MTKTPNVAANRKEEVRLTWILWPIMKAYSIWSHLMYRSQYLRKEWAKRDGWYLALNTDPKELPNSLVCSSLQLDTSLSILSITSKSSFDRSPVPSCRWYNRSEFKSISIALPATLNSVFRCNSISHPTSGVTAAVVQPNSRFASTRSLSSKVERIRWAIE